MKTKAILIWTLAFVMTMAWCLVPAGFAQEEDEVDEWLESLTEPGPDIKRLDALAGNWNSTVKVYADENDNDPFVIKGTTERRWVLGGRYLQETSENPTEGGVFIGRAYWGFDRATALYEYLWMSTEDVGMTIEHGRFDPTANVLRTRGGTFDPSTGYYIQNLGTNCRLG